MFKDEISSGIIEAYGSTAEDTQCEREAYLLLCPGIESFRWLVTVSIRTLPHRYVRRYTDMCDCPTPDTGKAPMFVQWAEPSE